MFYRMQAKMCVLTVTIFLLTLSCIKNGFGEDTKYSTKYDNFEVDTIINSPRLLKNYVNCVTDNGPCTAEGEEMKKNIPDALQTDCSKCSDKQKEITEKLLKHIEGNEPQYWEMLQDKYDPDKKYSVAYLESKKIFNEIIYKISRIVQGTCSELLSNIIVSSGTIQQNIPTIVIMKVNLPVVCALATFVLITDRLRVAAANEFLARSKRGDEERYPTTYDDFDVDRVLASERLMKSYIKCLQNKGACTKEGRLLKDYLPDALLTDCIKCSDIQKRQAGKVLTHILQFYRDDFNELLEIYDPKGIFRDKYGYEKDDDEGDDAKRK
ncbi:uncharacterized protein LOC116162168 [Photinus pyralis]|nr:uncharacterized protein LOC116162168 [Photinus pyralis]